MVEFPKGSKPVTTTLLDMRTRVVMTGGAWSDGLKLPSNTGSIRNTRIFTST